MGVLATGWELGAHAKMLNPMTTPSGKMSYGMEKERKQKIN